jgi:hypothetical protein
VIFSPFLMNVTCEGITKSALHTANDFSIDDACPDRRVACSFSTIPFKNSVLPDLFSISSAAKASPLGK